MSQVNLLDSTSTFFAQSDCRNQIPTNDNTVTASRARLAASLLRYQSDNAPRNEIYYPTKLREEEPIYNVPSRDCLDAIVTRNHYGSLVLNAHHALFMDVDMPGPCVPSHNTSLRYGVPAAWQSALDDLNIVLASERHTGFRIYRTAAGFRILATTREFEPGSPSAIEMMTSVGADSCFIRLCGLQQTFRARLSPKPWRCGATQPPNQFPRQSADEQRSFTEWLAQYNRACRDRATCQFLKHVGPTDTHERVAPIIELHDRETKALEELELA